jgi:predicted permease
MTPSVLFDDVLGALRQLRRTKAFAMLAILSVGAAIGATTIVFSIVSAVLLRPLPFPDSDRILQVYETERNRQTGATDDQGYFAWGNYADIRSDIRSFRHVAAWQYYDRTLTGTTAATRLSGRMVTAEFFPMTGVQPVIGRAFASDDERAGRERVAIIGHAAWRELFSGDTAVVGTTIRLDGIPHTLIGVMPPSFDFPYDAQLWMPLVPFLGDANIGLRRFHRYRVAGRLESGVTLEGAQRELTALARRLAAENPETNADNGFRTLPLRDVIVGDVRPALRLLFAAVLSLLLVGCANLAMLHLARSSTRERELAVRVALGARRGRLIRQLLAESVLLALLGGAVGLMLAWHGLAAFIALAGDALPRADEVALDAGVLGFGVGLSALVGLLFGLAPAVHYSRPDVTAMLRGGRGDSADAGARRIRRVLVVGQLAFAVVLAAGAGLLVRSFQLLTRVDVGIAPERVLAMDLALPEAGFSEKQQVIGYYDELLDRVRALPGVEGVAASLGTPLAGSGWGNRLRIEGRPLPEPELPTVGYRVVTADYFRVTGTPIIEGRSFDGRETTRPSVIVSRETARALWPNRSVVGQRVRFAGDGPWFDVVGVAGDVPASIGEPVGLQVYVPPSLESVSSMTLLVRAERDAAALTPVIRSTIRSIRADVPVTGVSLLEDRMAESVARPRFLSVVLTVLASLALFLACLGVYGVLAYAVSRRTRELAIRRALGAREHHLVRIVLSEGAMLSVIGTSLGLIGALALSRLIADLLFGIGPTDPRTLGAIWVGVSVAALLASWIPARRAMRVDPAVALQRE